MTIVSADGDVVQDEVGKRKESGAKAGAKSLHPNRSPAEPYPQQVTRMTDAGALGGPKQGN